MGRFFLLIKVDLFGENVDLLLEKWTILKVDLFSLVWDSSELPRAPLAMGMNLVICKGLNIYTC